MTLHTLRLAMYKGPPDGLLHTVGHLGVCLRTLSRYSHCELVFGPTDATGHATCWSSSSRDGGVREKRVQLTSGRWDVFALPAATPAQATAALAWFRSHDGAGYDWAGNAGFVLPWRVERRRQYFCSEAVAAALGLPRPWTFHPQRLLLATTLQALKEPAHA